MKLVEDRQTDRPTDRQTDIATYRAAIAAKNLMLVLRWLHIQINFILALMKNMKDSLTAGRP